MSLKPTSFDPVPDTTIRIARAAFPKGNPYLCIRDELGILWQDQDFAHLFARDGQPAECPWRLALVTVLQFVEQLTDRQAADAVRGRIDWGPLGHSVYALREHRTRPDPRWDWRTALSLACRSGSMFTLAPPGRPE